MFSFDVNIWAVLAAAVSQFIIGMLWYSPALFGNAWMKMVGISKSDMAKAQKKGMAGQMLVGFLGSIVMAFVLGMLLPVFAVVDWQSALQAVFWLWLGFVGTVSLGSVLWEGRPSCLWFLNNAYQLVAIYVMALVITYWPL